MDYYNTSKELIFTRNHLRDFEVCIKKDFNSLPKLLGLLNETVKDKDLLSYDTKWDNSQNKMAQGIVVKKDFLKPYFTKPEKKP